MSKDIKKLQFKNSFYVTEKLKYRKKTYFKIQIMFLTLSLLIGQFNLILKKIALLYYYRLVLSNESLIYFEWV